jgi:hypothetical protein
MSKRIRKVTPGRRQIQKLCVHQEDRCIAQSTRMPGYHHPHGDPNTPIALTRSRGIKPTPTSPKMHILLVQHLLHCTRKAFHRSKSDSVIPNLAHETVNDPQAPQRGHRHSYAPAAARPKVALSPGNIVGSVHRECLPPPPRMPRTSSHKSQNQHD